jgi:signal transduction histidine kinase
VTRLVVVAAASIGLILFVTFVVSRLARTRNRGTSIRLQVFLALAVIVGTFALGLGVMVIDRIEARAVRLASQAAQDEAATISGMLEGEMERTGVSVLDVARRLEQEAARGADLRLVLLDREGRVIFPRAAADRAFDSVGVVFVDQPLRWRGQRVGAVRVIKPTVVMLRLLEDIAPTVLVISLVLGAAAALAAAWIGRAIAQPIEALTRFAQRVSQGERTARPPVVSGREVEELTSSIDSMRRQLEGRPFVEAFAADLSHELKNPVAAIRATAELLEDGAIEEPEQARRFVARIRESVARIERLLGDLLSLARIEARGVETFQWVELGRVAQGVLDSLHEDAARVTLHCAGDTRVRGDAVWLARAIANLVDNALVHSDSASPVELRLERSGASVVLRVRSSGVIPTHVRRNLFRRFVTTRSDKGGSGLGLAIVRAVAEGHGGRIELTDEGPPRVEFRLLLPFYRTTGSYLAEAP